MPLESYGVLKATILDRRLATYRSDHYDRDPFFGFEPARGIHDIHQKQGNVRIYRRGDGVWQDGGLLVERNGAWTAFLLRFQSQSWRTDDASGHAR